MTPTKNKTENWETSKAMIREASLTVYPIISQDNAVQLCGRKGYEHATADEKERYTEFQEERATIQRVINIRYKQLLKIEKKNVRLNKTFHAWGNDAQYLEKHAPEVIYARKPIIFLGTEPRRRNHHIHEYVCHINITPGQGRHPYQIESFGNNKITTTTPDNSKKIKQIRRKTLQRRKQIHGKYKTTNIITRIPTKWKDRKYENGATKLQ